MNADLLAYQNEQLLEEIEDLQEQLAKAKELAEDYKARLEELLTPERRRDTAKGRMDLQA